jgi:hypothetical protein
MPSVLIKLVAWYCSLTNTSILFLYINAVPLTFALISTPLVFAGATITLASSVRLTFIDIWCKVENDYYRNISPEQLTER